MWTILIFYLNQCWKNWSNGKKSWNSFATAPPEKQAPLLIRLCPEFQQLLSPHISIKKKNFFQFKKEEKHKRSIVLYPQFCCTYWYTGIYIYGHWTKKWNWSSCTKLALSESWTHGLIAQSVRASEFSGRGFKSHSGQLSIATSKIL